MATLSENITRVVNAITTLRTNLTSKGITDTTGTLEELVASVADIDTTGDTTIYTGYLSDIASELNKYDDKTYTASTSNYSDYDTYVKEVVDDCEELSSEITTANATLESALNGGND